MKKYILSSCLLLPILFAGCDKKNESVKIEAPQVIIPQCNSEKITADEYNKIMDEKIQKWDLILPEGEYKLNIFIEETIAAKNNQNPQIIELPMIGKFTVKVDSDNKLSIIMRLPSSMRPQGKILIAAQNDIEMNFPAKFNNALINTTSETKTPFSCVTNSIGSASGKLQNYTLGSFSFGDAKNPGKKIRSAQIKLEVLKIQSEPEKQ